MLRDLQERPGRPPTILGRPNFAGTETKLAGRAEGRLSAEQRSVNR